VSGKTATNRNQRASALPDTAFCHKFGKKAPNFAKKARISGFFGLLFQVRYQDILLKNQDVLLKDQHVLLIDQDVLLIDQDVLLENQDILLKDQHVLLAVCPSLSPVKSSILFCNPVNYNFIALEIIGNNIGVKRVFGHKVPISAIVLN